MRTVGVGTVERSVGTFGVSLGSGLELDSVGVLRVRARSHTTKGRTMLSVDVERGQRMDPRHVLRRAVLGCVES